MNVVQKVSRSHPSGSLYALRFSSVALAALLVLAGTHLSSHLAEAAAQDDPTEAIKASTNQVIEILEDEELKKPERQAERRERLREVIGARFDYEEMSKRSLGKQWKKLDDAQRREFVELFTELLAGTYADKIEGYAGEQIVYMNHRTKGKYAEVKTSIVAGKTEFTLDYRLLYRGDEWRVYDVVVDGVSLVRNYRGQFTKVIRSSSYEDLVEKLREKVNADQDA